MSTKDTKRVICAGLIGLSLLAAAASVRADSHEHYLPLEVGNSWTYTNGTEEITFTIIGTEEINGHTYYKFDDYFCYAGRGFSGCKGRVTRREWGQETLLRYEPDFDSILMYCAACYRGEVVLYNFSGGYPDITCWYYPSQTGVTCNVPAGEFNDCYKFVLVPVLGGSIYDSIFGEYLAPNVGVVRYVQCSDSSAGYEPIIFELKSYRIGPIEAGVDIEPDVLNLKSSGKWITSYIWLPEGYNVADIDPDSVVLEFLEDEIEADWVWFDEEEEIVMAKFSRAELQDILEVGEEVELTISGELTDGIRFKGTDTIKVIDKGRKKE